MEFSLADTLMRIVWISHTSHLGGAELCLCEAAEGLVANGHEVSVIVPTSGAIVERLRNVGVSTLVIPNSWWVHFGTDNVYSSLYYRLRRLCRHIIAARQMIHLFKAIHPDLVVSNTIVVPSGALAAKWVNVPHIWYLHEFGKEDHGLYFDWGDFFSISIIDLLSSRVIVNSNAVLEKFRHRIPINKLQLVYYGIEVPENPEKMGIAKGSFNLVLVGFKSRGKRQADAILALSLLLKDGLDIHLTLVGSEEYDREYSSYLHELVEEHGIREQVNFVPFTNNPWSYIASSDVALMCSESEAFGRVTVEAMKLGKPVIGANSAGTSELIINGENGLLYRPGDIFDLAAKIKLLYEDRILLEMLSNNARERTTGEFTPEKYIASLLDLFNKVTRRAPEGNCESMVVR